MRVWLQIQGSIPVRSHTFVVRHAPCSQTRYRLPTRTDRKICAFSNFCASNNFSACSRFCASRNFCASSHFCAGSNFCASRNICVLFVLLLYVPKSTTMAMARRSAHLITYLLGILKKRVTSTSSSERECLTRDRGAAGSSLTGGIALCP